MQTRQLRKDDGSAVTKRSSQIKAICTAPSFTLGLLLAVVILGTTVSVSLFRRVEHLEAELAYLRGTENTNRGIPPASSPERKEDNPEVSTSPSVVPTETTDVNETTIGHRKRERIESELNSVRRVLVETAELQELSGHWTHDDDSQTRGRVKRTSGGNSQPTTVPQDFAGAFVFALRKFCKPEGRLCLPGRKGDAGNPGYPGLPGLRGPIGLQGIRGDPGQSGTQGPRGLQGWKGDQGDVGLKGDRGPVGTQGVKGVRGEQGGKGGKGEQGVQGVPGYKGHQGGKGMRGETGSPGQKGEKGENGVIHDILLTNHVGCQPGKYRLLNESWRRVSVTVTLNDGLHRCDRNSGWHRFSKDLGSAMLDSCPKPLSCGVDAPGWLQGSHPATPGQAVSRTVCFSWGGNCCAWISTIAVVNCGSYYVYNLPQTPFCELAYCSAAP